MMLVIRWFVAVIVVVALCNIVYQLTREHPPSNYCRSVWKLRDELTDYTPRDVVDRANLNEVRERAAWCDKHPQGIAF